MDHSIHCVESIKLKNSSTVDHHIIDLVTELRSKFMAEYNKRPEDYNPIDVDLVQTNDYSIKRFLTYNNLNAKQAFNQLIEAMKWKKTFGVKRDYSQCGIELFKTGALFIYSKDREGRPVLYARVKTHAKIQELERIVQDVIVITLERLDRLGGEKGYTVVMDVNGAGLSNVDMSAAKFMISMMRKYFPESMKCILVVNLPYLLKTFMPLVRLLLGSKYSHMLHTVSSEELFNYIDPDNVPKYLGGNSTYDFTKPPAECVHTAGELAYLYDLNPSIVEKAVMKFEPHINEAKVLVGKSTDINSN